MTAPTGPKVPDMHEKAALLDEAMRILSEGLHMPDFPLERLLDRVGEPQ
ncbi:MAG: hypothetical protein JJU40_06925 [Rhodobacteraceae bacterium]|nr:hypothetical protein [Paracoccaceae bacterium]